MSTEPSQLAIETANKMFSGPSPVPIQDAIDQACAQKDQELCRWAELKQSLGVDSPAGFFDYVYAKDQRIAELGGIAKGIEDLTIRKDQRIAELEEQLLGVSAPSRGKYIAELSALLDRVPHFHDSYNPEDRMDIKNGQDQHGQCASDCPACAWAALKGDSQQTGPAQLAPKAHWPPPEPPR